MMNVDGIFNILPAPVAPVAEGATQSLIQPEGQSGFMEFLAEGHELPAQPTPQATAEELVAALLAKTGETQTGVVQAPADKSGSPADSQSNLNTSSNKSAQTNPSSSPVLTQPTPVDAGSKQGIDSAQKKLMHEKILEERKSKGPGSPKPADSLGELKASSTGKDKKTQVSEQLLAQYPILDILSGKLQHVEPARVSEIIVKSPLVEKLMALEDGRSFLDSKITAQEFYGMIADPDKAMPATPFANPELAGQEATVRDFFAALGLNATRIEQELEQLRANVSLGELSAYAQRAERIQARMSAALDQPSTKESAQLERTGLQATKTLPAKEAQPPGSPVATRSLPSNVDDRITRPGSPRVNEKAPVEKMVAESNPKSLAASSEQPKSFVESTTKTATEVVPVVKTQTSETRVAQSDLKSSTPQLSQVSQKISEESPAKIKVQDFRESRPATGEDWADQLAARIREVEAGQKGGDGLGQDSNQKDSGFMSEFAKDDLHGLMMSEAGSRLDRSESVETFSVGEDTSLNRSEATIQKIMDHTDLMRAQNGGEVTLKVNDSEFGPMEIKVSVEGNNVNLEFVTRPDVDSKRIHDNVRGLHEAMMHKDLNLVDVRVDSSANAFSDTRHDRREPSGHTQQFLSHNERQGNGRQEHAHAGNQQFENARVDSRITHPRGGLTMMRPMNSSFGVGYRSAPQYSSSIQVMA